MPCGPIPASAATSRGMSSTENVGAEKQSSPPKGEAVTTIAGPSENNAADKQAVQPLSSSGENTNSKNTSGSIY